MIGRIVCSKQGRDKGYFLVVVGMDNDKFLVCDGKERLLNNPKRKNPKHIIKTNKQISEDLVLTDRALRKALSKEV